MSLTLALDTVLKLTSTPVLIKSYFKTNTEMETIHSMAINLKKTQI